MVTGSMIRSLDNGLQEPNGSLEDSSQNELELILRAQRRQQTIGRERDLNMYRSGSAPPTVEGSLSAVGSLFGNSGLGDINDIGSAGNQNGMLSEDEIRSHPAYLSYYYSHENINPRLPPPLLSKEDWRVAQRFQGGFGGIEDWRNKSIVDDANSSSLFSMQPSLSVQQAENDLIELRTASGRNLSRKMSAEWLDRGSDGLIGMSNSGLGTRRKSFADILQEGLEQPVTLSGHSSRPASRNAFGEMLDTCITSNPSPPGLCNGVESAEGLYAGAHVGRSGLQSHGISSSHAFASAVGSSLSRSTTPEQHVVGRSPGFGLPPVGSSKVCPIEKRNIVGSNIQNGNPSVANELAEIAATLSGLSLSKARHTDKDSHLRSQLHGGIDNQHGFPFNMPNSHNNNLQHQFIDKSNAENNSFSHNFADLARKNAVVPNLNASKINSSGQVSIPRRTSSTVNLYSEMHPLEFASLEGSNIYHPNASLAGLVTGAYSDDQKLNLAIKNQQNAGSSLTGSRDGRSFNELGNQEFDVHSSAMDPLHIQYLRRTQNGMHAVASPADSFLLGNHISASHGDLDALHKAYLEALLAQQKQQYELSLLGKSGGLNRLYYGNPSSALGMAFPGNPISNPLLSSVGSGNLQNERMSHFTSMMRSSVGGTMGTWNSDIGNNVNGRYMSSLLDEFKNNKTRSFELSDIVGHVVEFSTDQYGSRFIQQKLETATVEEKTKIFPEIIPHARTLMTDVFGNYVIQKFFEHGMESQRAELASQLTGHVLPLSLQMYGCRVIQKALEVVDVDQQMQMVAELDGSIMKCVRDQNGNHVIQKCIECVPQDRIQFIISSFYGQVVVLSTHPYGCRVIQRVLEHCNDIKTQQIIMDEIMQSVCMLAQDQYGNYVIQHVLEHGKPEERSAIISQLAGQIVKMSQQKFASNVVEKCLTFGGPEERQLLVKEMLGSTDENEPLQAMMKDPYGNYVVQKVLEICDDQSLELILSRIKVHLDALKRYTYGKHIVSRVEKLIVTGERRIGFLSSFAS
ncbi:hypothetical protein SLE2022_110350 [Rubroshorea leprosula]